MTCGHNILYIYIVLEAVHGETDDLGVLEIVKPAIARRKVTFRFTPKDYGEPHNVSLHCYSNNETSLQSIPIYTAYNDVKRKQYLLIAYVEENMNNKNICVKYNNNTCGSKTMLEMIGKCCII